MSWAVAQLALLRPDPGNAPERRLGADIKALTTFPHSELVSTQNMRQRGLTLDGKENVFLWSRSVSTRKV